MKLAKRDITYLISMLEKISMIQVITKNEAGLSIDVCCDYNINLASKLYSILEKNNDGV